LEVVKDDGIKGGWRLFLTTASMLRPFPELSVTPADSTRVSGSLEDLLRGGLAMPVSTWRYFLTSLESPRLFASRDILGLHRVFRGDANLLH